jgi:hypothetical protein
MRGRLLVIAVAATLVATPATAAPRSCATVVAEDSPGDPSSLDIRKVEVSVGKKTMTVRLTLDTTDPRNEPARMLGYRWRTRVFVGNVLYTYERERPAGVADTYRYSGHGMTFSVSRTAITWVADRRMVPELRKPKIRVCVTADTSVAGSTADRA